jgi:hypothetical protein
MSHIAGIVAEPVVPPDRDAASRVDCGNASPVPIYQRCFPLTPPTSREKTSVTVSRDGYETSRSKHSWNPIPNLAIHQPQEMSDQPWTRALGHPNSPSKRQRTSDAGSSSQWVERLSSVGPPSASHHSLSPLTPRVHQVHVDAACPGS